MKFLSLSQNQEETFWVLDIGNETVKVLVCKREMGRTVIIAARVKRFEWFGVFDSREFEIDVIRRAVKTTIEEVEKEGGREIRNSDAILGIPANIMKARITIQRLKRENPGRKIKKEEEKRILKEVLKSNEKRVLDEFVERAGILPKDIFVLKQKIIGRKINGYQVPQLAGFNGEEIEFKILIIFLPRYYFKNIEKILKDINFKSLKITHEIEGLTEILKEDTRAMFLDIGGELTQFYLVKNGALEKIDEFSSGGKGFTIALCEKLGLSYREAEDLKGRYQNGLLEEPTRKRLKEIFEKEAEDWFFNLQQKFGREIMPMEIFLFGGGSAFPEMSDVLERKCPDSRISLLILKDLPNVEDGTHGLSHPQYISPLFLIYGHS